MELVALQLEQQFAAANGFPLVGSNAMKQLAVTNMKKLGVVPAVSVEYLRLSHQLQCKSTHFESERTEELHRSSKAMQEQLRHAWLQIRLIHRLIACFPCWPSLLCKYTQRFVCLAKIARGHLIVAPMYLVSSIT